MSNAASVTATAREERGVKMLSLAIEIAILAAVVFEAVISWKHYQLSRRELRQETVQIDVCDECGFNFIQGGRCIVCKGFES